MGIEEPPSALKLLIASVENLTEAIEGIWNVSHKHEARIAQLEKQLQDAMDRIRTLEAKSDPRRSNW